MDEEGGGRPGGEGAGAEKEGQYVGLAALADGIVHGRIRDGRLAYLYYQDPNHAQSLVRASEIASLEPEVEVSYRIAGVFRKQHRQREREALRRRHYQMRRAKKSGSGGRMGGVCGVKSPS